MKVVDQRVITLTQDEVIELIVKTLCAANPGHRLENRGAIDIDLSNNVEVRLTLIVPVTREDDCDRGLGP